MERIERLVAHIDEGLILARSDQVARRRLALLLFDSAVELMMYRETSYALGWERSTEQMVRQHEDALKQGYEPSEPIRQFIEEAKKKLTSPKKRREIERYFDAKAAFLGEAGLLQPAQVRVLKRLHKYRNEAYHQDHLRPETLDSALRIYILVVCSLLHNLPIHSIGSSRTADPTPAVAKYLGKDTAIHFDAYELIARAILEREGMTSSLALAEALSDHFLFRLNEFDDALGFVAGWMSDIRRDGPWERDDALSLVQIKEDRLAAFADRQDVRNFPAAIRRSQVEEWRKTAQELRLETNELAAFATFADLEDAFEPIEHDVSEAAYSVDAAIQHEIDVARGK